MPDNQLDFYKAVKVHIKHIIKHPDINLPKINNLVLMSHKIIIHTLQFIKLYSLDYYDKNNKLPVIDKTFINCCMKIICSEKATGRPPKKEVKDLKDKLILFYDKYYKPIQLDKLEYTYNCIGIKNNPILSKKVDAKNTKGKIIKQLIEINE